MLLVPKETISPSPCLPPPPSVYIYTTDSSSRAVPGSDVTADPANMSFQDQRSSLTSSLPAAASSHHQNILSHLPLHSQQQACSLLPVVPVGGFQMLHSPPSSSSDATPSSAPSPESGEGRRCSSGEGSVHRPEEGKGEDGGGQSQLLPHQTDKETKLNLGIRDSGQEENVQTCLKAIASLKITTEDPH